MADILTVQWGMPSHSGEYVIHAPGDTYDLAMLLRPYFTLAYGEVWYRGTHVEIIPSRALDVISAHRYLVTVLVEIGIKKFQFLDFTA